MKPPDIQRVLITLNDNSVAVMSFVTCEWLPDGTPRWFREATDEAIDAEVNRVVLSYAKERLPVVGWRRITEAEVPKDRTFRDAWVDRGDAVEVDMPRARNVLRQRLRVKREPLLKALDTEYARADEQGDRQGKARIAQQKQVLRDITADPRIEQTETPDDLKKLSLL